MKYCILILLTFCIIFYSYSNKKSSLTNLEIQNGMERTKVEAIISKALNTKNEYSAYENNLLGGIVKYIDGIFILEIKYQAGTSAPLFINKQGKTQGLPLINETVESIKLYKK